MYYTLLVKKLKRRLPCALRDNLTNIMIFLLPVDFLVSSELSLLTCH